MQIFGLVVGLALIGSAGAWAIQQVVMLARRYKRAGALQLVSLPAAWRFRFRCAAREPHARWCPGCRFQGRPVIRAPSPRATKWRAAASGCLLAGLALVTPGAKY